MMVPSSIITTRSAASRAKPISCVTTIIVMPSWASSSITVNTSPITSGSSALVGSSKRINAGFIASARAMATRCCCPPESFPGYVPNLSARPTRVSNCSASTLASFSGNPSTWMGASQTFSSAVLCGKRLKRWKTMPICVRWRAMLRSESSTSLPFCSR